MKLITIILFLAYCLPSHAYKAAPIPLIELIQTSDLIRTSQVQQFKRDFFAFSSSRKIYKGDFQGPVYIHNKKSSIPRVNYMGLYLQFLKKDYESFYKPAHQRMSLIPVFKTYTKSKKCIQMIPSFTVNKHITIPDLIAEKSLEVLIPNISNKDNPIIIKGYCLDEIELYIKEKNA